jgi:hypothetical protein
MEAIKTFKHAGYTIRIMPDDTGSCESPDSYGNTDLFLITTRNRYFEVERKGFTLEGCRDGEYRKDYHVLPLQAYIHSGVCLSLGQFHDPWDSGQIGYVLVQKRAGFRNIQAAAQSLVDEWNSWLSGEVYGFIVEDSDGEHIDSCWGFIGDIKFCIAEAKSAAEAQRKDADEHELSHDTALSAALVATW